MSGLQCKCGSKNYVIEGLAQVTQYFEDGEWLSDEVDFKSSTITCEECGDKI